MKRDELKLYNGNTAMMNVERMLSKIQTVCAKVEKATDAYKSIMEDVAILHFNAVHKGSGMSFVDYMHDKTGMGETTCKSLVAIQKHIEYEVSRLESQELASSDDIAEYRGFMKTCSMRELLMMSKNEDITTEYVVLHGFNIYKHDGKVDERGFENLLRESLELAKDKYVKLRHVEIEQKDTVEASEDTVEASEDTVKASKDTVETFKEDESAHIYQVHSYEDLTDAFAEIDTMYHDESGTCKIIISW